MYWCYFRALDNRLALITRILWRLNKVVSRELLINLCAIVLWNLLRKREWWHQKKNMIKYVYVCTVIHPGYRKTINSVSKLNSCQVIRLASRLSVDNFSKWHAFDVVLANLCYFHCENRVTDIYFVFLIPICDIYDHNISSTVLRCQRGSQGKVRDYQLYSCH